MAGAARSFDDFLDGLFASPPPPRAPRATPPPVPPPRLVTKVTEAKEIAAAKRRRLPRAVLVGHRFGTLVVVELGRALSRHTVAVCKCDCGKVDYRTHLSALWSGTVKSCGCVPRRTPKGPIHLKWKRFGRLVVEDVLPTNGRPRRMLRCQCDCGNTHVAQMAAIVAGRTTSCGCYRNENLAKARARREQKSRGE